MYISVALKRKRLIRSALLQQQQQQQIVVVVAAAAVTSGSTAVIVTWLLHAFMPCRQKYHTISFSSGEM